jgi:hypothetical protein
MPANQGCYYLTYYMEYEQLFRLDLTDLDFAWRKQGWVSDLSYFILAKATFIFLSHEMY